jgi:integrase
MSAALSPDRPLLRLHAPAVTDPARITIRYAFEEYLVPELTSVEDSTRADYQRFINYWEDFERFASTSAQFTHPAQGQPKQDPRIAQPWVLTEISSRVVSAFSQYLLSQELGPSTVNKAVNAVKRVIELAGQEGHEVNAIKVKALKVKAAPKHYLDDLQIQQLWSAANGAQWPSQVGKRRATGSGMPPSTFWRSVLIMLRTYGMRVQDLVAYESRKSPILWGDVTLSPRTPNPEGKCDWELGWLHYTASKTGHEYYLPLTRHARAAIDRLAHYAQAACGGELPADRPILPCPTGHGLNNTWKILQATARVTKPTGEPYQLEDFRKTCATYLDEHCPELAYHVCGWVHGGSKVAHKHYINSERKLVASLPSAPMPGCFDEWLENPLR